MQIILQNVVLHVFFYQDILQYGGGDHLRFMHQRDFKIKKICQE